MQKSLRGIRSFNIGFWVLMFFAVPALLGYIITPDSSKDANQIAPEIANQPPGFHYSFVREAYRGDNAKQPLGWLTGYSNIGNLIPVKKVLAVSENKIAVVRLQTGDTTEYKNDELEQTDGRYLQSKTAWLGTDRFGRDLLSRLIIGARISLSIGLFSVIISLLIGLFVGVPAGYFGGTTDKMLSWFIAVFWSVPTLLIALALSFAFGKGYWQVLAATGLSTWVEVARVVRGQAMQIREKEFIMAARINGFKPFYIMRRHVLPNLKGSLTVLATTNFAAAIMLEAGLSFLGLGISPPTPSWGMMVKEHLGNLVMDTAWLAIIPGVAIMLLVMAFNLMSMGLRDYFDTRLN